MAKLIINPTAPSRREIPLSRSLLSIGRDPSNDLVLPDAMVSRRHAVIEYRGSQYFLRDCNSSNGSLVNGDRVSERSLRDGDLVAIGTARLLFRDDLVEEAGGKVVHHPSSPRLQCPACQAEYRKGDLFCKQCGVQLAPSGPPKAVCASCGTVVPLPANFCNACGSVLAPQDRKLEPTKPRPAVKDEEEGGLASESAAGAAGADASARDAPAPEGPSPDAQAAPSRAPAEAPSGSEPPPALRAGSALDPGSSPDSTRPHRGMTAAEPARAMPEPVRPMPDPSLEPTPKEPPAAVVLAPSPAASRPAVSSPPPLPPSARATPPTPVVAPAGPGAPSPAPGRAARGSGDRPSGQQDKPSAPLPTPVRGRPPETPPIRPRPELREPSEGSGERLRTAVQGRAPGFGTRMLAGLVDAGLVSLAQAVLVAPALAYWWSRPLPSSPGEVSFLPIFLSLGLVALAAILGLVYYIYFWGARGATPGKRLLGLEVEGADGTFPIGTSRAALRLVGYAVSSLLLGIGFLMIAFTGSGLHDRLAGTRVVRRGRS